MSLVGSIVNSWSLFSRFFPSFFSDVICLERVIFSNCYRRLPKIAAFQYESSGAGEEDIKNRKFIFQNEFYHRNTAKASFKATPLLRLGF